jgi:hypothetical protein
MSTFVGKIGQEVNKIRLTLKSRQWVGRSRPVMLHTFSDSDQNEITIFSTRKALLSVQEGDTIEVNGRIKDHKVIEGRNVTVINDFYVLRTVGGE